MEINIENQINLISLGQLVELIRMSFSQMLKEYLHVCKLYDRLMTEVKKENPKKHFFSSDPSFYDENGKINWAIIRQFMPWDFEKIIKEEYSMLNEHEIRLCCLLFFKLSLKQIEEVLPYKQKSIGVTKMKIKRKTRLSDLEKLFAKIIVNNA